MHSPRENIQMRNLVIKNVCCYQKRMYGSVKKVTKDDYCYEKPLCYKRQLLLLKTTV